jgi:hypothetical protein
MAEEIYIVRDQITPVNEVTIKQLIEENIKLRADISRIGHERDDMARAAQELQARLSRLEDDRK